MWNRVTAMTVAVLFLVPLSGVAQVPQQQREPEQQQQPRPMDQRERDQRTEAFGEVIRADRLIGENIRDRQDRRIGRITDLAFNTEEGKVEYAVVAYGGFLGIGDDHAAVSFDRLNLHADRRIVLFDGTEADLERAPRVDPGSPLPADVLRDEQPGRTEQDRMREQDQQRDQMDQQRQDQMTRDPQRDPAAQRRELTDRDRELAQRVVPMDRLIGIDVQNRQGENLGRIHDFAVTMQGEVPYAVVSYGGFLGFGDTLVAVPWDQFDVDAREQVLMLDITRQQLETARPFEDRERWPARIDSPFVTPTQQQQQ